MGGMKAYQEKVFERAELMEECSYIVEDGRETHPAFTGVMKFALDKGIERLSEAQLSVLYKARNRHKSEISRCTSCATVISSKSEIDLCSDCFSEVFDE